MSVYRLPSAVQSAFTDVRPQSRRTTSYTPVRVLSLSNKYKLAAAQNEGLSDEAAKLLAETDKLIAELGGSTKRTQSTSAAFSSQNLVLQCDESGCTIVPVASEQDVSRGPTGSMLASTDESLDGPIDFDMMEGVGWKLGYDRGVTDSEAYSAVIGGDGWMATLTLAEYDDFVKSLLNLQRSIATLEVCGEWSERGGEAHLEMSTERVWLQGRAPGTILTKLQDMWNKGKPAPNGAFSLRFIFTGRNGREVSGSWTPSAVLEVLTRLDAELAQQNGQPQYQSAVATPTSA